VTLAQSKLGTERLGDRFHQSQTPISLRRTSFRGPRMGKPRKRVQKCLDCCNRKLELVFNPRTGIYEGRRICKVCAMATKRRFLE
jgi:hypothetical protein